MSKNKLVIIHTTSITVEPLKRLAIETIPDVQIINLVDDSILPQLAANGGRIEGIQDRWREYALIAEKQDAACILNACSSIGELCALVQPDINVPIVRIDDAMASYAIRAADVIGVAATLATTMNPTLRMLRGKAKELGKSVELVTEVASSAYQKLIDGDKEGHDEELAAVLRGLAKRSEIVVLAQASMASVLTRFTPDERERFLTSPALAMANVKSIMTR
ncbi:aspartate/glutamate racemase [Paenibacillus endophyticus]|uniref:Aspartate/glutamate racemase n=1 Tax=Paenibacillus endophyticus TaxID=1294268 RepID=A0A7W5C4H3_9BACL|nr:aspartate/glutamate racemase family protein [Paenibacillus endophyticus]MBB3150600.1 aspartate/glutamate racemase [Paenibacillus endophyticus]